MSYHIEFNHLVLKFDFPDESKPYIDMGVACKDSWDNSTRYALFVQGCDHDGTQGPGYEGKYWYLVAFGLYEEVISEITTRSERARGGCLRHYGKKIPPKNYIRLWKADIECAIPYSMYQALYGNLSFDHPVLIDNDPDPRHWWMRKYYSHSEQLLASVVNSEFVSTVRERKAEEKDTQPKIIVDLIDETDVGFLVAIVDNQRVIQNSKDFSAPYATLSCSLPEDIFPRNLFMKMQAECHITYHPLNIDNSHDVVSSAIS